MSKAQSEARLKMLYEPGHLYACYSRYCDWIKLGFSSKVEERLEAINRQYAEFAPFSLIGKTPSMYRVEQQMHSFLAPFRQRHVGRTRELYPAVKSVSEVVRTIVESDRRVPFTYEQMRELREWGRRAAGANINRIFALEAFNRYMAERRAA